MSITVPAVGDPGTAAWADSVAAQLNGITSGAWTAYTPVLSATTTNPTLGTASAVVGRYMTAGKYVKVYIRITFGTSGTNAGSGTYSVSLPVTPETANSGNHVIGDGYVKAAGLFTLAHINSDGILRYFSFPTNGINGTSVQVTNNQPGVFTANDVIELNAEYEAA